MKKLNESQIQKFAELSIKPVEEQAQFFLRSFVIGKLKNLKYFFIS